MGFRQRILTWLAVLLALVVWGLALPLTLLFVSHDHSQVLWILLPYAWEVPLLGLFVFLLPLRHSLDAVADFVDSSSPVLDREFLKRVRRRSSRLPLQAAGLAWATCLAIQALAALQMRHFGSLPTQETVKVLVLGLPLGLLCALPVYFLLAGLLGPPLERCQASLSAAVISGPRVPLFWKAFACLVGVAVLAVSLMGLLSYSSTQRLLETNLASEARLRLAELAHARGTGRPWGHLMKVPGAEGVGLFDSSGAPVSFRGAPEALARLQAEMPRVAREEGTLFRRTGQGRLLAWKKLPGGETVLAEVPLSATAEPLTGELRSILLLAAGTLALAFLLALVLARSLSRPLVALTALAARIPQEWPALPEARHSDDEIGTLSLAFQSMLNELRTRRDDLVETNRLLGRMIAERTLAMRDLETLLELSRLLSSTMDFDSLLGELSTRIQTAMRADGVAILLVEHHDLALRAATGSVRGLRGRRIPLTVAPLREAFREGLPVTLTSDQPGSEDFLRQEDPFYSAVLVPMRGHDMPVGLVALFFHDQRPLQPEALNLLRSIAEQAGLAIRRARLFEEKSRVTELLYGVLKPSAELGFPGLEVGSLYIPSRELSGDYLDLIPLGERRVGVIIADVAGKGSEAALEAVRLKHTIQICAAAGYPPGLLVRLLNEQLHRTAEDLPRTVTLFYGELDLEHGMLRFVSAGHEPPIVWRPGTGPASLLGSGGIILGASPDASYDEVEVRLEPGSWMVLYTDGITEARSPAGELFGQERLLDLLSCTKPCTARSLADRVDRAIQGFSQGELNDDLSLLVLRCLPPTLLP